MKKYYSYILICFTVFGLISCENDDNLAPVGNWELSEPSLISPDDGEEILLQEDRANETFYFEWEKAVSTAGFQVRYELQIDTLGSENHDSPIISMKSDNNGKATTASIQASDLDLALSYAGYSANESSELEWTVVAICQDTRTYATRTFNVMRFENEYVPSQLFLSGTATEAGTDIAMAIPMRHLENASGEATYIFEVYTSLEAGQTFKLYSKQELPAHQYGGGEGVIEKNGSAIAVEESGQYRITVNLNDHTYSLWKIENWSIVGNIIPNGWGGDEPLEYIGNGIWEKTMFLTVPNGENGGFLFRANHDWGYLLKRIQGTSNEVYMESQAGDAGIDIEDIPLNNSGEFTVTLDLSGDTYTYNLESNLSAPSETPSSLFLLENGTSIAEFSLDQDTFTSEYLPLQAGMSYSLNSAQDGSGTSYFTSNIIGATDSPDGDSVASGISFVEGEGEFSVDHDQAYKLSFNFATGSGSWQYYNIKLFHWQNWEDRNEFLMTYVHPMQFTTTQNLEAGYNLKFNSPWDVQFGTPDGGDNSLMSGALINGGGDLNPITQSGSYEANLTVDATYTNATFEFVAQ
ncbi:SusE domain-containing protein [Mesonia sp.]|uniref:SusE domain-containing protein n=1 Tax=Mesonia sp. TaxID=1960830 RepID=UPI0017672C4B|nr:SusE domain-containing protein [Mesonia sp.]HIB37203.1 SusF/SusE family outer membrane protein [Mesonia sp.]HIO26621.1 SusF/SusE family outer membrane protein [Flavobacteriaceae bacterium]